jgi:ABC-2 type transport system permease protein
MTAVALALRQVRFENRAFWRNPAAAFFTVVFPLIFLVVADAALVGQLGDVDAARFYTPAIMTFALVTSCYTNLAMGVVVARDAGVLKRLRGTPLPTWAYLFGRIGQSVIVTLLLVAVIGGYGALVHGVVLPIDRLPALAAALVVGAASFSALGLAITRFVPNASAAPAVVNATILPLLLISNVLVPVRDVTLASIASVFPVGHLADAIAATYDPASTSFGWALDSLAVVAAWGVAGLVVALLTFSWQPRD